MCINHNPTGVCPTGISYNILIVEGRVRVSGVELGVIIAISGGNGFN